MIYFHSMTDEELLSYCVAQSEQTPLETELYLRLAQRIDLDEPDDVDVLKDRISDLEALLRIKREMA